MDSTQRGEICGVGLANATGKRSYVLKEANSPTASAIYVQVGNKLLIVAVPLSVIQRMPSFDPPETATTSVLTKEEKSESENSSPNAILSDVPPLRSRKRSYAASFIAHQQDVGKYRDNYFPLRKQFRRLGLEMGISGHFLELEKRRGNIFIENEEILQQSQPTCVGQEDALLAFSILGNFDSKLKIETEIS